MFLTQYNKCYTVLTRDFGQGDRKEDLVCEFIMIQNMGYTYSVRCDLCV